MRDESERRALAAKYRQHAEQAQEWAGTATSETLREDYLRLAIGWIRLADDIEESSITGAAKPRGEP
jgi:hypothetical protein